MGRMDHVGLIVGDLDRSLAFYRDAFGFPEHSRLDMGETKIVFLDVGGTLLELVKRSEGPVKAPEGRISHIAFHADDYDGLLTRLEGMGAELQSRTLGDGSRITFLRDPDGHNVEIDERPFNQ